MSPRRGALDCEDVAVRRMWPLISLGRRATSLGSIDAQSNEETKMDHQFNMLTLIGNSGKSKKPE